MERANFYARTAPRDEYANNSTNPELLPQYHITSPKPEIMHRRRSTSSRPELLPQTKELLPNGQNYFPANRITSSKTGITSASPELLPRNQKRPIRTTINPSKPEYLH